MGKLEFRGEPPHRGGIFRIIPLTAVLCGKGLVLVPLSGTPRPVPWLDQKSLRYYQQFPQLEGSTVVDGAHE